MKRREFIAVAATVPVCAEKPLKRHAINVLAPGATVPFRVEIVPFEPDAYTYLSASAEQDIRNALRGAS